MPAVARIESTLAFNDVAFTNGIERAEKRAATFGGRVEATFNNLFRRTPGRRAERALSGLVGDIATGSLSQGIMSFAGRLTGLGLAAGVGVGVAIELFDKLYDSVKEVRAAHEGLEKQVSKPIGLIAGLSPEGISEQANQLSGALDKLREVRKTFTHGVAGYLEDFAKQKGNIFTDSDFGKSGLAEAKEESDVQQRLNQIRRDRGRIELELAQAREKTKGDEKETALTNLYFTSRQKENAIKLEGGKGAADQLKALQLDEKRLTDEIVHRAEVREQEFATAEKLLKLERSGIPEDKKKVLAAAIGLDVVNKSLESPDITTGERRALTLEKLRKENEVRSLTKSTRNPFAWGTPAAREWEDQNSPGFGSIARRTAETNDPSVYGSLAANRAAIGEIPQAQQGNIQQMLLVELQKLTTLTEKVWTTE